MYFKTKNPLKTFHYVNDLVKNKTEKFLIDEEWKKVIYHIYQNEDAKYIESKILEFIKTNYIDVNKLNENYKYYYINLIQ